MPRLYWSLAGLAILLALVPTICTSEPLFQASYYGSDVGLFPKAIVAGDFNRDGNRDLVVANIRETASVLLGRGDGTFQPKHDVAVGTFPCAVVTEDLNRDGIEDLIFASEDSVHVLLGSGDGTFQTQVAYRAGSGPICVVAVDVNGDGLLDVVAGE